MLETLLNVASILCSIRKAQDIWNTVLIQHTLFLNTKKYSGSEEEACIDWSRRQISK